MNAEVENVKKQIEVLEKQLDQLRKTCDHKFAKSNEYFTDYELRQLYTCSECGTTKSEFICDAPRF